MPLIPLGMLYRSSGDGLMMTSPKASARRKLLFAWPWHCVSGSPVRSFGSSGSDVVASENVN